MSNTATPSLKLNRQFRVTVFGSSSKNTSQQFVEVSVKLGEEIANKGYLCVNGAGSTGTSPIS
jgi:predicted Rossmann-fold nucleotide-binding protein